MLDFRLNPIPDPNSELRLFSVECDDRGASPSYLAVVGIVRFQWDEAILGLKVRYSQAMSFPAEVSRLRPQTEENCISGERFDVGFA